MKLFQQMLVATATLGFIAPIAAQASDVLNLEGMNDYKKSSKKSSKKRFDSNTFVNKVNEDLATLENSVENPISYEAGSFSDTTTLDTSVVFSLGGADVTAEKKSAHDDTSLQGRIQGAYTYQMNLNTSFTGDDNLYTRIKSGNHSGYSVTKGEQNTYLKAGDSKADVLKVDKIWYSTPVGENHTVFVGPKIENYYMHATTPSIYKPVLKAFALGGNGAAYGASTSPGAGWAYNADNGFAVSSNFTTQSGNTSTGMLSNEGKTSWATQVGYTKPNYSVSAIVNMKYNGWADTSYFTSDDGALRPGDGNSTNIGLRGWWRPENTGTATPSISLGYDTSETDATGNSNTTAYFVGLNWQDIINADDRIGVAIGQPQKHEDDVVDPFLYEVYYDYKVNDSVTVTPTIFGGTYKNASRDDIEVDMKGYVLNTTFKF